MKRAIGVIVLAVFLLAGCNQIGTIFDPVIGSWETTILGVTVGATFNTDGTFSESNSLGELGVTTSGTWTSSSDLITKTWDDESTAEYAYSFNSDKTEMTLTRQPVGVSVTYTRQ